MSPNASSFKTAAWLAVRPATGGDGGAGGTDSVTVWTTVVPGSVSSTVTVTSWGAAAGGGDGGLGAVCSARLSPPRVAAKAATSPPSTSTPANAPARGTSGEGRFLTGAGTGAGA